MNREIKKSKVPVPVYVFVLDEVNLTEASTVDSLKEWLKRIKEKNAGGKVRIYASDYYICMKLTQLGLNVPWGKTLISDRTDSDLYKKSNGVFCQWIDNVSKTKSCFYKDISLAAIMRDEYVRKFRDLLLAEALCKIDQESEEYYVHILLTLFPFYYKYSNNIVNVVEVVYLYKFPKNDLIRQIKYVSKEISCFCWYLIMNYRLGVLIVLPLVEIRKIIRSLFVDLYLIKRGKTPKCAIEVKEAKSPRLLFVVVEPYGKNCLDPLISILKTVDRDFECSYEVLIDNQYSLEYLKKHSIESHLISGCQKWWEIEKFRASMTMKKVALRFYRENNKSIEGLLYLKLLTSDIIENLDQVFYRIEFCDSFVKNYRPDVAMVYPEESYSGFAAIYACRKRRMPTMTFLQSIASDHELYNIRHADKMAIYGTHGRDVLLRLDLPEDYIVLTGNPKLDSISLRSLEEDKKYVKSILAKWNGRPLVILATHLLVSKGELAVAYFLLAMAGEGAKLFYPVIKLHPDDDIESYRKLVAENLPSCEIPLIKDCDLYALLHCAGIVVTGFSTVGAEAALLDKPLMTLNFSGVPLPVNYAEEGIAIEVNKKKDIIPTLKKMMCDAETTNFLAEGRKRFIERYAYKLDGKSGYRVIRALFNMAVNKGPENIIGETVYVRR